MTVSDSESTDGERIVTEQTLKEQLLVWAIIVGVTTWTAAMIAILIWATYTML